MDCSHVDNGRGQEDRNAQMSEHGDTSIWSSHGSEGHSGLVKKKKNPKKVTVRIKART